MRLLIDVNIEQAIIEWLRSQGHDLLLAREAFPRAEDEELLQLASTSSRVVITKDKDFGDLIFRDHRVCQGVILLRLRAIEQYERLELLKGLWHSITPIVDGNMIVVTNDHIRIRPLTKPPE